jgi:hypothetical protein
MAQLWADGLWASGLWDPGLWAQAGNAPVITNGDPPGGAVGVGYTFTFTASGDLPITWAVTVGVLPDGLTLSAGGVLSGTPTTEESQTFTVEATGPQDTDTASYTVVIGIASTGGGQARDGRRSTGRGMLRLVGRG